MTMARCNEIQESAFNVEQPWILENSQVKFVIRRIGDLKFHKYVKIACYEKLKNSKKSIVITLLMILKVYE